MRLLSLQLLACTLISPHVTVRKIAIKQKLVLRKRQKMFVIFAVVIFQASAGFCSENADIHHLMSEPELMYYFRTSDKAKVPEYEIVYLPEKTPIKSLDDEEEIDYSFSAFER